MLIDHTTQQLLISQSSTTCSCHLEQSACDLQMQTAWAVARQWWAAFGLSSWGFRIEVDPGWHEVMS